MRGRVTLLYGSPDREYNNANSEVTLTVPH